MIPGSKLIIKVNPEGNTDLLQIKGAHLNIEPGSNVEVIGLGPDFPPLSTYTIVQTTEPIIGHFDRVVIGSNGHFQGSLIYSPNEIKLFLKPLYFTPKVAQGNASCMAQYLDYLGIASCDLRSLFNWLDTLSPCDLTEALFYLQPSQFGALALAQEICTVAVRSAISHRLQEVYTNTCSPLSLFNLWIEPFALWAHQKQQSKHLGYHQHTYGAMLGFDYHPLPHLIVGVGISGTSTQLHWEKSAGKGFIQAGYAALYASWFTSHFSIDASILSSYDHYDAKRPIAFINREAHHKNNGYELAGQLALNLFLPYSIFQFQPQARAEYITLYQNDYNEHKAEDLNMKVEEKKFHLLRTELGLIASTCYKKPSSKIIPEIGLSWVNETRLNNADYEAHYPRLPSSFKVDLFNPNRNFFSPTAALSLLMDKELLTLSLRYTGQYASHFLANSFSAQLNWNF